MFWHFSQIYQKVKVHKMFKIFSILDNIKIQQLGDVLEWFFRGFLKVNLSNQSFSWCVQFAGRVGNDICGVPKRRMGGCKGEGNNETRSRNSRRYCRTSEWAGPKVDFTLSPNCTPIIFRILTFMPQRSDLKSCPTNASLGRSHHNSSTGILEQRSKVVKTQSAKDEKWKFSGFRKEIFALFNYIPDQSVVFWRGVQNLNTTNLHEYLAAKGVSNICEVSAIFSPNKEFALCVFHMSSFQGPSQRQLPQLLQDGWKASTDEQDYEAYAISQVCPSYKNRADSTF